MDAGRTRGVAAVDAPGGAVGTLAAEMKIYTRTGDDGTTGLLGAARVPKHDARVESYGTVDELNASLGVAIGLDPQRWLADDLKAIQSVLFRVGAELATVDARALAALSRVGDDDVGALERGIDRLDQELAPLTRFVLPGGTPLAAQLHLARTVCRRAERRVTALAEQASGSRTVQYLNRLADLLFTMARYANHRAGVAETTWPDA
jgi:cob(I)alamin adenosyltransferase